MERSGVDDGCGNGEGALDFRQGERKAVVGKDVAGDFLGHGSEHFVGITLRILALAKADHVLFAPADEVLGTDGLQAALRVIGDDYDGVSAVDAFFCQGVGAVVIEGGLEGVVAG